MSSLDGSKSFVLESPMTGDFINEMLTSRETDAPSSFNNLISKDAEFGN